VYDNLSFIKLSQSLFIHQWKILKDLLCNREVQKRPNQKSKHPNLGKSTAETGKALLTTHDASGEKTDIIKLQEVRRDNFLQHID